MSNHMLIIARIIGNQTELDHILRSLIYKEINKANSRLERLIKNNAMESKAYRDWLNSGGKKFSIKGMKSTQSREFRNEMNRLSKFLDDKTSTMRGTRSAIKSSLNNIANMISATTGKEMRRDTMKYLEKNSRNLWKLERMMSDYLDSMGRSWEAMQYHKIIEAIIDEIEQDELYLEDLSDDFDEMLDRVQGIINKMDMKVDVQVIG